MLGLGWIAISMLVKIVVVLPMMIVVILTTATAVAGCIRSFVVWHDIRSIDLFKSSDNSHMCA